MRDMSDLVPTLAVVAAFAQTATTINGVGFIRNKESDRIGDLANELRELGVLVDENADGLTVHPSKPHGGAVNTHHDHRLAMSLALIGLVTPGVVINDPMVVTKSWPEYWTMLGALQ
jgi:3-phosphoshikimate 1-carboxyvinyltransferase